MNPSLRPSPHLAGPTVPLLLALALALVLAPAAAHAGPPQAGAAPAAQTAEAPASHAEVPADPFDRGTPRSAMHGYLAACRAGDHARAAQYLELAEVPEAERAERGPVLARWLKEVLDQSRWIDLEALSDEAQGDRADGMPTRDRVLVIPSDTGPSEVQLERVPREDGVLVWKIAARTVADVPALHAQYGVGPLLDLLPRVLVDTHFLEIALWQWIGLVLVAFLAWLAALVVAAALVRFVRPLTARTESDLDDKLVELLLAPAKLLATIGIFVAGSHALRLSVPARAFFDGAGVVLTILGVAWFVFRTIDLAAGRIRERLTSRGQLGVVHLVPVGARVVKAAVAVITVLAALDTFGFDVTAVIAGLGIGGLAVALAAQKTIENVFGGISVLVDQPVRPGDACRFGGQTGTVEDIGMRSTRIRTLDRTVISVPNAEFSNLQIENFAKRDRIRLITTLGLRYETSPDQLRHVLTELRRLLLAHPKVLPEPQRVRMIGFGASSIDVELFCYVDTTDFDEFLAVREDVFLRILDVVAASGTGFAFPSTTTYLARDGGLDADRKREAEERVAEWRSSGRLMFPSIPADEAARIDDSLDWPPQGSAAARGGVPRAPGNGAPAAKR